MLNKKVVEDETRYENSMPERTQSHKVRVNINK